jgi:indolepyruvate ferredoxin oxidoreductase beta subunit
MHRRAGLQRGGALEPIMKYDIIFAGVGGQGIVLAAAMLVAHADRLGLKSKQNEVHGMAQRGGAVVCHVRLSDREIFSDIIPMGAADIILGTEPMESLRYINYLSPEGTVITSNKPVKNIEYPDTAKIISTLKEKCHTIVVDIDALVTELKNEKMINLAMMGALSKVLKIDGLREGILKDVEKRFASKGEGVIRLNHRAFEFGEKAAS